MTLSNIEIYKYEYFVFDLDNTLYREADYLYPAYLKIGKYLDFKYCLKTNLISNYLITHFENGNRSNLFNLLIERFNLEKKEIIEFLKILRNLKLSKPIDLFPEMELLLINLNKRNIPICILTNGNVNQQKNKVNLLNWKNIDIEEFVFANEFIPKPSPVSLEYIINKHGFNKNTTLFIGDSDIDEECANNAGVKFILKKELFDFI